MNKISFSLSLESFLTVAGVFSKHEGTALLYSGGDYSTSNHSFLFLFPIEAFSYQKEKGLTSVSIEKQKIIGKKNPWDLLKEDLSDFNHQDSFPKWVGYFSYEMGYYSDVLCSFEKSKFPLAFFQRSALVFCLDHKTEKCTLHFDSENRDLMEEKKWFDLLTDKKKITSWIANLTSNYRPYFRSSKCENKGDSKQTYIKKIKKIQDQIKKGEVYQVCLSHEMIFTSDIDPFDLFLKLNKDNPSPFSAYFCCKDYKIISLSPERFIHKRGNILETKPIKGTAPRGKTIKEDQKNKQELATSEKERSELSMITDLLRNDLGKISEIGSVDLIKSHEIESYTNVFQMLSTIRSRQDKNFSPVDIMRNLFPGGSITGCPKLASQGMIKRLEDRPRGIYTGSIGYFSSSGDFDFNIVIRTMLNQNTTYSLAVGGGIVIDSDPEKEYEETMHKGKTFFQAFENL